jgi:hypothetical protein
VVIGLRSFAIDALLTDQAGREFKVFVIIMDLRILTVARLGGQEIPWDGLPSGPWIFNFAPVNCLDSVANESVVHWTGSHARDVGWLTTDACRKN